jgi:hypothetical protein
VVEYEPQRTQKGTPTMDTQQTEQQDIPLPEPSLLTLVTGLAAQAMVSLGVFPNPMDGQTRILLHQGKHFIDTIALLSEKTSGHQTPEESKTFESVLHELRMVYIAAQNEQQKRATGTEG